MQPVGEFRRHPKKVETHMQLRYMGFDQAKNIREYRFDGIAGDAIKHFVVSADLTLFTKHHIGMQEGPALCLQKLSADTETPEQLAYELTNDDLAAHVSARAALAEQKLTSRRKRPPRPVVPAPVR